MCLKGSPRFYWRNAIRRFLCEAVRFRKRRTVMPGGLANIGKPVCPNASSDQLIRSTEPLAAAFKAVILNIRFALQSVDTVMYTAASLVFLAALALSHTYDFRTAYSWRYVDFRFPNETIAKAYETSGDYIQKNNLPLGLAVWRDRMFVTVPRWKKGVLSTLNYFRTNDTNESPTLIPYPDLESNDIRNPSGIINVFRVRVDACDRLWGVDTGIDDIFGETKVLKPMRLVVYDLKKDEIIRVYPLKESDQKSHSFMAEIAVDVEADCCDDAYAYISDLGAYGIVVYSWAKNDSWRIEHNYFHFDPLNGDYNIGGYNFQWTDGVFGMSLSPVREDGHKTLYFHAMSGITEFYVSTDVLKDDTLNLSSNYHAFHVAGNKGPNTQGPSSVIDRATGIDYFIQVNKNGIACWDTTIQLTPDTLVLVAQDNSTMLFPNDLTIDHERRKLYVLSNNLARFQFTDPYEDKQNYFITEAPLDELAKHCGRKDNPSA